MRILPLILSIVALATTAVVALELNARVREYREVVDEQQRALVKLCKEVASNRYLNFE